MKYKKIELLPGKKINGYTVLDVIGQGGFGITYLAEKNRKQVAIKELFYREFQSRNPEKSDLVYVTHLNQEKALLKLKRGFLKEGAALQKCKGYPGLVNYIESFEANNTAYIVMEYIRGKTLRTYLKESGPLPYDYVFQKMRPIMKSLDKMHRQGIVHRDISPDNIIMSENGDKFTLVDFGSARMYNTVSAMTAFYKDGYSPVEQYVGDMPEGPWTDIYSMGATMYYALTRKHPLSATVRIVYDEIRWPSRMKIEIQPEFEKLLRRMMETSPKHRAQNFQQVLAQLNEIQPERSGIGGWFKNLF